MTDPSRDEVLAFIREGLADADAAIRAHPTATVAVYEQNVELFTRKGYSWARQTDEGGRGLSDEEARLVDHYMLAMSFMSAWYHLNGDRARRDKAAQSAATLVGGTGLDGVFAFKALLHYEVLWRDALRAGGVVTPRMSGCASVVALIALAGSLLLLSESGLTSACS